MGLQLSMQSEKFNKKEIDFGFTRVLQEEE